MFKILSYNLDHKIRWGICDLASVTYPIKALDVSHILDSMLATCLEHFYSSHTFELLSKAFVSWPSQKSIWIKEEMLLPPIPQPTQIVGMGLNYQLHRDEVNTQEILVFPKNVKITSGKSTVYAHASMLLDWEIEVGAVLGSEGVPVGFVLVNDISDRVPIIMDPKFGYRKGKEQETFLPVGPFFIPAAFTKFDKQEKPNFPLKLFVNGILKQQDCSTSMIHGISSIKEQIIKHRSQIWQHDSKPASKTLPKGEFKCGDLILTGTPGGVAINPPTSLNDKLGILYRGIRNSIFERKLRTLKEQFISDERNSQRYLNNGDVILSCGGILGKQALKINIFR